MDKELYIFFSTPDNTPDGTMAFRCVEKLIETGIIKKENWSCVTGNTRSLAAVYNEVLKKPEVSGKILVYIHSDLIIDDIFVKEKLNERFSRCPKAVAVGIAGGGRMEYKPEIPQLWHLITLRATRMGEVGGNLTNDILSPVMTTSFGLSGKRAILIDGCFMAIDVDRLKNVGVVFDENSPSLYNFYDLIFSVNCYLKGAEIYVDSIRATHKSPGLLKRNEDFNVGNEYFKKNFLSKIWK